MLRDITIGQYYQTDSLIHEMDPRTKIIGTLVYIIFLFVFNGILEYAVLITFLAILIWMSKVPLSYILKGLKTIVVLLIFTAICQILFTSGGSVLYRIGSLRIYSKGVYNSVFLTVRLVLLVIGSSMMTYTTTPNQLTDGLEYVLRPLRVFRVDVHDIAMMMSIALRYIPILMDEADRIIKAQTARGADFEHGNFIRRAKNLVPILVPLFVAAFRRASELALAMEARCYRGGEGRTKMKPLKYSKPDYIAYGCMAVLLAVLIIC